MNVWMRERRAGFTDSAAHSMSAGLQRARPAMTGPSISDAMRRTASASSFDAMGNPASITSTPSTWSWRASRSFSAVFIEKPGACSPSRRVVSKMISLSSATVSLPDCVLSILARKAPPAAADFAARPTLSAVCTVPPRGRPPRKPSCAAPACRPTDPPAVSPPRPTALGKGRPASPIRRPAPQESPARSCL